MAFTTDVESSTYKGSVYLLIFGEPKIGKTHSILELASTHRQKLIYISADNRGLAEMHANPSVYKGKVVFDESIQNLVDVRRALDGARAWISRMIKKNVPREKIWVVLDTITHLQSKLLAEARRVDVGNPKSSDSRDDYVREMTTQVDWGVNLGHMSEVADALTAMPANVIVVAHTKEEVVDRKPTGVQVPDIRGQSFARFTGDADVVMQMIRGKSGRRYFRPLHGDRFGKLESREPADIKAVYDKLRGLEPQNEGAGQGD